MSVSAIFGTRMVALPTPRGITGEVTKIKTATLKFGVAGNGGLMIECSSRPQKKATAHHKKTRPRKTQAWDIRRKGPTAYAPLPKLPAEWSFATDGGADNAPAAQSAVSESQATVS